MVVFKCEAGELECRPVDMKEIRKRTAEWEADHPEPAVPLLAHPTFEAVTSGRGVDMLPNPSDPAYQQAMREWNWKRYQFSEAMMVKQGVKLVTPQEFQVLALVMIDGRDGGPRQQLYRFIQGISEVTQEAVDKAARRFRLQVARQTLARLADQAGQRPCAVGRNGVSSSGRVVSVTGVASRQIGN